LDELDKAIMAAWEGDCRLSYQALARRFQITSSAIKKRVKRLIEVGAIESFAIELSLAMLDAEFVFIDIVTDGTEDFELFMDEVGKSRQLEIVWRYTDESYGAFGEVVGVKGLIELGTFLRQQNHVTEVEVHPAVGCCPVLSPLSKTNTRGRKVQFTPLHLRVLDSLIEDPRMPMTKIAETTGLTTRRVKKVLTELQHGGGVYFTLRWNHHAFGDIELEVRLQYDDATVTPHEIFNWFKDNYNFEYWVSYIFGDAPIIEVIMVVKELRDAETITSAVQAAPFTNDVNVRVIYPKRRFPGLGHHSVKDLLLKARNNTLSHATNDAMMD
jgi:DNA-binding Lrp family transcriptional regulator